MVDHELAAVRRAAVKAGVWARLRDQAIREAHDDGQSLRAIAAAAGLSYQRVHQIVAQHPAERANL